MQAANMGLNEQQLAALEQEINRLNAVKASEVASWFERDRIALFGPRVAVLRDPNPNVSDSGIIMTEVTQKRRATGSIVAIGVDVVSRTNPDDDTEILRGQVAVGDRVTFNTYGETTHRQQFSNGKEVILDVFHISDIYFCWRNEDIDAKDIGQQLRGKDL